MCLEVGLSVNHLSDAYKDENGQDVRYNEDNDHFALYIKKGDAFYEAGVFKDSFFQDSYYVGAGRTFLKYKSLYSGVFFGIAPKYKNTPVNSVAFAGFNLGLDLKYANLDIFAAPFFYELSMAFDF